LRLCPLGQAHWGNLQGLPIFDGKNKVEKRKML